MPDLSLKRISLRNWMLMRDVHVDFPEHGLVWVTGSNQASGGRFDSVGSGKTGLGEAICYALLSLEGRNSKVGENSTYDQGNLYVKVEATLKDKPLIVETGHRCVELSKTGEGFRYAYDSQPYVQRGHFKETKEELTRMIGVTPELARWTVFIDGEELKFHRLSRQATVELVMTALAQPPWTQWHAVSRQTASSFESEHSKSEIEHQTAVRSRDTAAEKLKTAKKDLASAESDLEEAKRDQQREIEAVELQINAKLTEIQKSESVIDGVKARIKVIEEEKATQYHNLETRKQTLSSTITTKRLSKDQLTQDRSTAASNHTVANKKLTDLKAVPKTCPTCKKPWDKAVADSEVQEQERVVQKLEKEWNQAKAAFQAATDEITRLEEDIKKIDSKLRELRVNEEVKTLSFKAETEEEKIDSAREILDRLNLKKDRLERGPDATLVDQRRSIVHEREQVLKDAEQHVLTTAATITETREAVKVVRYWVKAFSPNGIPNMVLKDLIEPLNEASRRVSSTLTGGMVNVSYSTTRELASGSERDELVIKVDNKVGSKSIRGSSKGQAGLANLIISETLSSIGNISNRVGFRWYDEILNSQDPIIRKSVIAYLKELATRQKVLIFFVDHHPEIQNYADHVLQIELSGEPKSEKTEVRWLR